MDAALCSPTGLRPSSRRAPGRVVAAWAAGVAGGIALLASAGCRPDQYAQQADKAVYRLVKEKQQLALGQPARFDVAYAPFARTGDDEAAKVIVVRGKPIPVGPLKPCVLNLADCLQIAVRNSREYQTQKEDLYSEALSLANLRHDWSLLGGAVTSEEKLTRDRDNFNTWSGTGAAGLTFTQQLLTGGAATLATGLDFATDFLGIRSTTFGSFLSANVTQPLWRGAWRGFAYEDLYRAERDLALSVIEYDRYRQTFAVGIAADYYRVLQRREQLADEEENLGRVEQTAKFVKAQADEGMISRVQADQAEQDVLNAKARIEQSRQSYRDALDAFKLTLGLPIAASVEPDRADLAALKPLKIPFDEPQAIRVALRTRPDVLTQYAGLRDARRDVEIAADGFNPRIDVAAGISVAGKAPRLPFKTQFHRETKTASLVFDYQLDQTDNRDAYRLAVIAQARAQRDLEGFLDQVQLEVRRSYRSLIQSENTYGIQKASVALAKRRTKLARLEQKEGLASTRDVLEAENALRSSKIALTTALVDYVNTRLQFLATLGMISVNEQGRFNERNEPFYLDRYRGDAP